LILISVDNETLFKNFKKTVKNQVDTKKIISIHIPEVIKVKPKIAIWGLNPTEDNTKIWNTVKKGDIVLFFKKNHYFAKSKVISKKRSKQISELLWEGTIFGKNREIILFLEKIIDIELD